MGLGSFIKASGHLEGMPTLLSQLPGFSPTSECLSRGLRTHQSPSDLVSYGGQLRTTSHLWQVCLKGRLQPKTPRRVSLLPSFWMKQFKVLVLPQACNFAFIPNLFICILVYVI